MFARLLLNIFTVDYVPPPPTLPPSPPNPPPSPPPIQNFNMGPSSTTVLASWAPDRKQLLAIQLPNQWSI